MMISDRVGARELFTLDGNGVLVRGTYHKATHSAVGSTSGSNNSIGVIFINALFHPRAANADSAVYWADCFADMGYPSFRLDLPGLGDSYGVIPNDLLKFINEGGYTSITAYKVKELVRTFSLSGAVLFGHCAGSTTAVYVGAECKECVGLVLMDPYFNLPKVLTSKLRPGLVHWARRSKIGAIVRATYDWIREVPGVRHKQMLPANANAAFISRWSKVLSSGVPALILKSPEPAALGSDKLRAGTFDYLGHIQRFAVRDHQLTIKTVTETNHSFANRTGRAAVRQQTGAWLNEYFPKPELEQSRMQELDLQVEAMSALTTFGTPLSAHASFGE